MLKEIMPQQIRSTVSRWLYVFIIFESILVRFLFIGSIPPGNHMLLRSFTALSGVGSIILLMLIVDQVTKNRILSWLTGLSLSLIPWHIEQSRIISPVVWILALILGVFYINLLIRKKSLWLLSILIIIVSSIVWYPEAFSGLTTLRSIPLNQLLNNLFHLMSFELWFFKNDSMWIGGIHEIGILLPSLIPLFLLGLIESIKRIKQRHIWVIIYTLGIFLIAAVNPQFPEGRLFFLILPIAAIVLSLGTIKGLTEMITSKNKSKYLWLIYFLVIGYEYLWYWHFYIAHYAKSLVSTGKVGF